MIGVLNVNITYDKIYKTLKEFLCENNPIYTKDITKAIKDFFNLEENNKLGIYSRSCTEYLTDVHITSFNPLDVVERGSLQVKPKSIQSLLTVESELGGSGASSPYGIMKNVVEDFCKLLLIQSQYKILVFTSLKYTHESETDYILNRVKTLKEIYEKSCPADDDLGVLLIHIKGSQPYSTQVHVEINENSIKGFVIASNKIMRLSD